MPSAQILGPTLPNLVLHFECKSNTLSVLHPLRVILKLFFYFFLQFNFFLKKVSFFSTTIFTVFPNFYKVPNFQNFQNFHNFRTFHNFNFFYNLPKISKGSRNNNKKINKIKNNWQHCITPESLTPLPTHSHPKSI